MGMEFDFGGYIGLHDGTCFTTGAYYAATAVACLAGAVIAVAAVGMGIAASADACFSMLGKKHPAATTTIAAVAASA